MIEKEAPVKVYNETLGAKGAKGRLVRVTSEGFYEISLEISGRNFTTLLPVASTVVLAAEPEAEIAVLPEVER
jgi:hypothetical protein